MAQPLVATGRLIFPYTQSGVLHKFFAYVKNPTLVGANWQINSRTSDANDLLASDAVNGLALAMESVFASTVSIGTAILQTRSGGVWTPVASYTPTAISPVGSSVTAAQITATFRDSAFHKMKLVLNEQETQPPGHTTTLVGLTAAIGDWLKQYTASHTTANPPYLWQVSRSNLYLNTSPFVALTMTFNKHLRRIRGYL